MYTEKKYVSIAIVSIPNIKFKKILILNGNLEKIGNFLFFNNFINFNIIQINEIVRINPIV